MSDEGRRIRERRERLGLDKKELAEEAEVHRNTLSALENGESFNRSTLAKLERALDRLELEAGINAPPVETDESDQHIVKFRVEGIMGVRAVTVEGPVQDVREFEGSIARIIRQVQAGTDESESGGE
ncbi:MAG TPA: helix-turn-helix transcriptional regulator [Acidimicrobiales bacterium]|nr:helix-turn-helix transcriptional regulator [Acidimicrobiales bacterium]